jgi:hypothetical protein
MSTSQPYVQFEQLNAWFFFIIYIFMQLNVWFLNVNVQFLPTSKIPIFHYFEETREITFINLYWPLFYYKVKTSSYLINWKKKFEYFWCLFFIFIYDVSIFYFFSFYLFKQAISFFLNLFIIIIFLITKFIVLP